MVQAISESTRARTQQQGDTAESDFVNIMKSRGREIWEASKNQNMFDHIDYFVRAESGNVISFDVKAYKGSAERGQVLLEFKNVKGNKGWLYGKADFIALQLSNGQFLCVNRKALVLLGEKLCDLDDLVGNVRDALYKGYTRSRWGRDDLISCIRIEDVINNCNYTII